jgi:methyltransferase (TIGR00027 family)
MTHDRGPSRSAALVAACRMLAAELPEHERLIDDPFAHLVADAAAVAAARADEPLQNTLRLRTRYIDDAILAFSAEHEWAQVLLLGVGFDARPFRLDIDAHFFEVDFPATLRHRSEVFDGIAGQAKRTAVAVDLASEPFAAPLTDAGFKHDHPCVVVWEGVSFYLDTSAAEAVVEGIGALVAPGSMLVADYAEASRPDPSRDVNAIRAASRQLNAGGEPLRSGIHDLRATLRRSGFDLVDDEAIELLRPRYGLAVTERRYPSRIFTALRR